MPSIGKVCRRGHAQTPSNTYLDKGRRRCLLCRHARNPTKGRTCPAPGCGVVFHERGNKSAYCPEHRHLGKWRKRQKERRIDLVEVEEEPFPLDSPYERAKQYIAEHFGVEAEQYINAPDHILNMLHYAVSIRYYNELPDVRHIEPKLSEEFLVRRAMAEGYTYRAVAA